MIGGGVHVLALVLPPVIHGYSAGPRDPAVRSDASLARVVGCEPRGWRRPGALVCAHVPGVCMCMLA